MDDPLDSVASSSVDGARLLPFWRTDDHLEQSKTRIDCATVLGTHLDLQPGPTMLLADFAEPYSIL